MEVSLAPTLALTLTAARSVVCGAGALPAVASSGSSASSRGVRAYVIVVVVWGKHEATAPAGRASVDGGLQAPYAGTNRIRFQGCFSARVPGTPASGAY